MKGTTNTAAIGGSGPGGNVPRCKTCDGTGSVAIKCANGKIEPRECPVCRGTKRSFGIAHK